MKEGKVNRIRRILRKHSPIDIYIEDKTNPDEYDSEIRLILSEFNKNKGKEDFRELVYKIFVKMFGKKDAGNKKNYAMLSDKIYDFLFRYPRYKLPELPENERLGELIGELYLIDGYLAGAISTNKKQIVRKSIEDMEKLLTKIKRVKTSNSEKQDAINYILESLDIARLYTRS